MKIIQSCWSCGQQNFYEFNAGWYGSEYNLMSWTLSCLQLNKYYKDLVLYADYASARTLIDELQLPYSSVCCELDKLNKFDPGLWALPKIYTYSVQQEPFLHVDGDAFIWKPFEKNLLSADLIAQNVELATDYYENIMVSLEKGLEFFPEEIIEERKASKKICAFNAGIIGGSDISLFKEYTKKAFEFVNKNANCLNRINASEFNVFFEQYLFYCIVKRKNKKVSLLLPETIGGGEYWDFADFIEVPHNKQFLHLLGLFKVNKNVCDQLAQRLRFDHPEYYYRIIALLKNKQLKLKKNYFLFFDSFTEAELLNRHWRLRESYIKDNLSIENKNNTICKFESYGSRVHLVESLAANIVSESDKQDVCYNDHIIDISIFEENINALLSNKFSGYSKEYLYARDIASTEYFEIIFGEKKSGYNTYIITDPIYEIIESRYDWTLIDFNEFGEKKVLEQLESNASLNYSAIIPECDPAGYSLVNIDDLDLAIIEMCKKPNTIYEILNEISFSFDPTDLEGSRDEFEKLIIGRIKIALSKKLMKVVQIPEK